MRNTSIADYIYCMIKEEKYKGKKYELLEACKNTKMVKLWNIIFETDVRDVELLENRIYEFGSMIKEGDSWGREIFVCLVAFLNLVIK